MKKRPKKRLKKKSFWVILFVVLILAAIFDIFRYKKLANSLVLKNVMWGLSSTIGRNLSFPNKYSSLLPNYEESKNISIIETENAVTISVRVKDDVKKISEWYEKEVIKQGYKIRSKSTHDKVTNIWFYKDGYKGSVTLSDKDYSNPGQTTEEIRVNLWLEW